MLKGKAVAAPLSEADTPLHHEAPGGECMT